MKLRTLWYDFKN